MFICIKIKIQISSFFNYLTCIPTKNNYIGPYNRFKSYNNLKILLINNL